VTKRSVILSMTRLAGLAAAVTSADLAGLGPAAIVAGALSGCVPREGQASGASAASPTLRPSVDAARELDQEGVRSYRSGRYKDAIEYFRGAYQLGGPSSELWNIVRCREGLDDAEGAAAAIDDYLSAKDVSPQDRADAAREAQGLRSRPSNLTVTTSPSGASVSVDSKPAVGPTPLTIEVHAGSHTVVVRREGYSPAARYVDARFGRAVIVSVDLDRAAK
jgi:hypothetical protein